MKIIFLILTFFLFDSINANESKNRWIGDWIAVDQWRSEFEIKLKKEGKAISSYGDGDEGEWTLVNGSVVVLWDSGKKDFLFEGIMGKQRIHEHKDTSYTSGIKKKLSN